MGRGEEVSYADRHCAPSAAATPAAASPTPATSANASPAAGTSNAPVSSAPDASPTAPAASAPALAPPPLASPASAALVTLGLALLIASNLMLLNGFSPATAPVASAEAAGAATFASVFHIGELLAFAGGAGAAGLILALAGRRCGPLPGLPLLLAGGALAFIGLAALWMKQGIDPANLTIPDALLCGAPIGAGNSLLFALWARIFGGLSPRAAATGTVLAAGLGIAASTLTPLALGHAHQVEMWMTIQLGTCAAAAWLLSRPKPQPADEHAVSNACTVFLDADTSTANARCPDIPCESIGSQSRQRHAPRAEGRLAVLGLTLFLFILGVYWRSFSTAVFYSELLEGAVALGTAVLVAGAALLLRERPRTVFRIALPLGAVLLLADPFLSFDGTQPMAPSGASWTVCLVVFLAAGCDAVFARAAENGGAGADRPAGAAQALWSGGLFLGVLSGGVTDPYGFKLAVTVVMVLFLGALLVSYARHPAGETRPPATTPTPAPVKLTVQDKVHRATGTYRLSAREAEVLEYLIQGRGEAYIAEALFISVSTVKTHRKNIYRKMGVSGREDLLDWSARQ